MFRATYTNLTKSQIGGKLKDVKAAGGGNASLAGAALLIRADKDFQISYKFIDEKSLTFSLRSGKKEKAQYTALEIKSVVLFSHIVPETQTTLNVIWDRKTGLVTVFEFWFSGKNAKEPRELSREIYQGYAAAADTDPPAQRHSATNRLENKAVLWTDESGKRVLEIYNSTLYCSFVELDEPSGGIPIAVPADYIKINDEIYIHSRVYAEFSGEARLEVFDLFTMKRIGVRFGFDAGDELIYSMYTHSGELTGQLATFADFANYGGNTDTSELIRRMNPEAQGEKGLRFIYRVHGVTDDLTEDEARDSGQNPHVFPTEGPFLVPTTNCMPESGYLVGKEFSIHADDGFAAEYKLSSFDKLSYRLNGEKRWHEETYKAFEAGKDLVIFAHMRTGSEFGQCLINTVDFSNGLATVIHSRMGNGYAWREVGREVRFGVLRSEDGPEPPERLRHAYTTELVGRSFSWNYTDGPDEINSMHVYSSPWGYTWTIYLPNQEGGIVWSAPCIYIKLREDAYILSWIEENNAGGQGVVVINPRTMHDGGFIYGDLLNDKRAAIAIFGAYGRSAGQLDILKYYEPKVK